MTFTLPISLPLTGRDAFICLITVIITSAIFSLVAKNGDHSKQMAGRSFFAAFVLFLFLMIFIWK